jgi:uncharacterized cupredoxin-like copper-binding protein
LNDDEDTMRRRQLTLRLLAGAWLAATLLAARAHGDAGHGAAAPVKEQKPWGIAGAAKQATRTVRFTMGDDMRFVPASIDVREGETLRIEVTNRGRALHEFVLGTAEELAAHAEMMKKHPGMEHDEPYMVHVAPGRTGRIVWTFNRPGRFDVACLIPGHFDAGMKGVVVVSPR